MIRLVIIIIAAAPIAPPIATLGVIFLMYHVNDTFSIRISVMPPIVLIVRSVLPNRQK